MMYVSYTRPIAGPSFGHDQNGLQSDGRCRARTGDFLLVRQAARGNARPPEGTRARIKWQPRHLVRVVQRALPWTPFPRAVYASYTPRPA